MRIGPRPLRKSSQLTGELSPSIEIGQIVSEKPIKWEETSNNAPRLLRLGKQPDSNLQSLVNYNDSNQIAQNSTSLDVRALARPHQFYVPTNLSRIAPVHLLHLEDHLALIAGASPGLDVAMLPGTGALLRPVVA
jgi:hypothetical protein